MPKRLVFAATLMVVMTAMFVLSSSTSDAAFHLMRVYNVNGGANGDPNVQYVELRMTDPGQSFVSGHHICFYDATGAPYARFGFTANVANGADEASILVGTAEFDAAWPVSSPDFTFSMANTVAIAGGADQLHPLRAPAGKVSFGTDGTAVPANMCQGSFSVIDSVAYGSGFTGTANFPPANGSDLPNTGTQGLRLQGPICYPPPGTSSPCASARNNSVDYAIVDVNITANNPRRNTGVSGPISAADADGDGVVDGADLCPGTVAAAPVDLNGCSAAQVDADADTICDPGAPSGGPGPCTGSDNCPNWPNTAQNLPSWVVPPDDPDCDGFNNTREMFIGTNHLSHCMLTGAANDEPPPDSWGLDFDDNRLATILDVSTYSSRFNSIGPNPPYAVRWDYNADGRLTILDVSFYSQYFNKSCL